MERERQADDATGRFPTEGPSAVFFFGGYALLWKRRYYIDDSRPGAKRSFFSGVDEKFGSAADGADEKKRRKPDDRYTAKKSTFDVKTASERIILPVVVASAIRRRARACLLRFHRISSASKIRQAH